MSFDYLDKSAYDTDDSTVLAIDQTCFSDAIFFLWWVLFELFKQAFSVGDVYPYPTPPN